MKVYDDHGNELDATFVVERDTSSLSVVFESRGGKKGSPDARNLDYAKALERLLARLSGCGARIKDAVIDSARVRNLPLHERRLHLGDRTYPIEVDDVAAIQRALSIAQRTGGVQNPRSGWGNATKRIRLYLAFTRTEPSCKELESWLAYPELDARRAPVTTPSEPHTVDPETLARSSTSAYGGVGVARFRPKNAEDYVAFIRGGMQHRTRRHEVLVRDVGEFLRAHGADMVTPHPLDLEMRSPRAIIFEAKIVGDRDAVYAIREALGQLLVYRHFIGPRTADLCVLLDEKPAEPLIDFVENAVGAFVLWSLAGDVCGGPRTVEHLNGVGVHEPQRLAITAYGDDAPTKHTAVQARRSRASRGSS